MSRKGRRNNFVTIPELGYKNKQQNSNKRWKGKLTQPQDVFNIFFPDGSNTSRYQVSELNQEPQS